MLVGKDTFGILESWVIERFCAGEVCDGYCNLCIYNSFIHFMCIAS